MKPFPQNLAFKVVVEDADEEGLSEMAQHDVDDAATLLVSKVVLVDRCAYILLL